jgi:hypothetical protein
MLAFGEKLAAGPADERQATYISRIRRRVGHRVAAKPGIRKRSQFGRNDRCDGAGCGLRRNAHSDGCPARGMDQVIVAQAAGPSVRACPERDQEGPVKLEDTAAKAAAAGRHRLARPWKTLTSIVQHFDMAADMYTSDADLAAGLAGIARAALASSATPGDATAAEWKPIGNQGQSPEIMQAPTTAEVREVPLSGSVNAKGRRDPSQRPLSNELPGAPVPLIRYETQTRCVCSG